MALQPSSHFLDIAVRWTELLPELFGRQPLAVARRRLILLVLEQLLQCTFLLRAALEHKQHAVHAKVERSRALVELQAGERMDVSLQNDEDPLIHCLGDARRDIRRLCRSAPGGTSQNGHEKQDNVTQS